MFESISFIGSGRIARIMLTAWRSANALPQHLLAYDSNPAAVQALQADFPMLRAVSLDDAAGADLVFAAVHPPVMAQTLAAIAGKLKAEAIFCSLAPKVKLATLGEKLGGFSRLARMNPNAPSIVGQGYNPIAFGGGLPPAARDRLMAQLESLGQSPEVDESTLESYAVISAMGPTYFAFQFAEVERLAKSFGLAPAAASDAMRAMLHGTVELLFASAVPREVALDLVPVRPMAQHEAEITGMLKRDLEAIFSKLSS